MNDHFCLLASPVPDQVQAANTIMTSGTGLPFWRQTLTGLALGCFVGSILAATVCQVAAAWLILASPKSPWGWTLAAVMVALGYWPLGPKRSWFGRVYTTYCCTEAPKYFGLRVITEEGAVFDPQKPYVVGLEPHSALPTALPAAFGLAGSVLPEGLRHRCHGLASSICFRVPLVRQLYWWWGIRPITRHSMRRLLHKGRCVVLVPGGVQECLFMEHGRETAFLSKRRGFIRLAMQTGSHIVPCFAFGQTGTFKWFRPGPPLVSDAAVQALSRRIGMVPMLLVGRWGTPVPYPSKMTVVFGKPIEVPHEENPTDDLVQEYLERFISDLKALFEKHKKTAGYTDSELVIM